MPEFQNRATSHALRQDMHPCEFESQVELARSYYLARGRVEMLTCLLKARFGPLSDKVHSQLACSSFEQLHAIGDRLLTAASLEEALAPKS
jgi:hypothetical protein